MLQVIWTTAGTFMLMFIAALQDLPAEVEEAAMVDGANRWQRFRNVTVMTIPTALVFIAFQRFFTQGANVGAEKG